MLLVEEIQHGRKTRSLLMVVSLEVRNRGLRPLAFLQLESSSQSKHDKAVLLGLRQGLFYLQVSPHLTYLLLRFSDRSSQVVKVFQTNARFEMTSRIKKKRPQCAIPPGCMCLAWAAAAGRARCVLAVQTKKNSVQLLGVRLVL